MPLISYSNSEITPSTLLKVTICWETSSTTNLHCWQIPLMSVSFSFDVALRLHLTFTLIFNEHHMICSHAVKSRQQCFIMIVERKNKWKEKASNRSTNRSSCLKWRVKWRISQDFLKEETTWWGANLMRVSTCWETQALN